MKLTFTKHVYACIYGKEEVDAIKFHEFGWSPERYYEITEYCFEKIINSNIFAIYGKDVDTSIKLSGKRVLDPERGYIFFKTPKGELMPVGVTPSRKSLEDAARAEKKFGYLKPDFAI